ncbi:MAG: hypothetical protein LUQ09_04165 [Methanomassiliicoccales archaeon]|nr:hypothetical protein [Methanomassiliicoccales archaeon]
MKQKSVHPLPLSLFLANSAIFAFKKKGKGAEVDDSNGGELPNELGDIDFDDDLKLNENGDLDFGGGGLPDLGDDSDLGDDDGISMPNTASAASAAAELGGSQKKKMDELNGSMLDLQSQMEKRGMEIKGVKNDLDSIKGEMGHISESMKKMLCIYEAVSRQYNPFVQEGDQTAVPLMNDGNSIADPFNNEDLDHVITPNDLEERKPAGAPRPAPEPMRPVSIPVPEMKPKAAPTAMQIPSIGTPEKSLSDAFIASCMTQISRIIEMKTEKESMDQAIERIYVARLNGVEPSEEDIALVDRWYSKMRR